MINSMNLGTDIGIKLNDTTVKYNRAITLKMETLIQISIEEYKTVLNFIKL
jgi:hypothetical protein